MSLFRTVFTRCSYAVFCTLLTSPAAHAGTWQTPTPEELKMTSQPEVPGAPAVVLYHEEITDDHLNYWSFYSRIKILSVEGRDKYSTVALTYPTALAYPAAGPPVVGGGIGWLTPVQNESYSITNIEGRTIHADGTVIPFNGKAFDRDVEKSGSHHLKQKVFTLPDVQVGSIIEYRYNIRYPDNDIFIPDWYVQGDLFTRKQHYVWRTILARPSWTATVPGGTAAVKKGVETAIGMEAMLDTYTLDINNVAPEPKEVFNPPLHSLEERVNFYQTPYPTVQDFWSGEGKDWSAGVNRFIGSSPVISDAATSMTAGAATSDEKLRRIYAGVMQLENTRFTRDHSVREDKGAGLAKTRTVEDIFKNKRGTPDQLTMLFVALARAAGFKAHVMMVVNRDKNVFVESWLTLGQFDDAVAIVEVDGKERFFDPGQRYCPYGQLQWMHTAVGGLRQTEKGIAIATTPMNSYKDSQTLRLADLVVDASGHESGTVTLTLTGAAALDDRQAALSGDEASLHEDMEHHLRDLFPAGTETSFQSIENLQDYEKPLIAHLGVSGPLAVLTAKHAVIPADVFQATQQPLFPETTRMIPVYFNYPERVSDTIRIKSPETWQIEAPPTPVSLKLSDMAAYKTVSQVASNTLLLRREYVLAAVISQVAEYPKLRDFYNSIADDDRQPVVFSIGPAQAAKGQ